MMDCTHLAEWKCGFPAVEREGRREVGLQPRPTLCSSLPALISPPPLFFFDVVTPNLEPPRRTNGAARPRLAAHFAGRWQTIRHGEWRLRSGGGGGG